jgi:hypothetical protein
MTTTTDLPPAGTAERAAAWAGIRDRLAELPPPAEMSREDRALNILRSDIIKPATRRAIVRAIELAVADGRDRPKPEHVTAACREYRARWRPVAAAFGYLPDQYDPKHPVDMTDATSGLGDLAADFEAVAGLTVFALLGGAARASFSYDQRFAPRKARGD